jgi:parallel beta helix pectate lyase-like protein
MRPSKRVLLLGIGALVTAMTFPSAVAADSGAVTVRPGDSIQDAVDAAAPGDTVVVKRGTYFESVSIQKDGITLKAKGRVTLRPPKDGAGLCNVPGDLVGICVVPSGINLNTNAYTTRVMNVTIRGFKVVGFAGDGIFGFGTKNFHVSDVRATDNTSYGVASFDGIGTQFTHNAASGAHDAGLYVGDSPDANAVIRDNRSWDNALGILVRHARHVLVYDNDVWSNCLGVFLLHDGQVEGSGDNAVLHNRVRGNNESCTQFAGFLHVPSIGGGGIVAAGSLHNVIAENTVTGNRGTSPFSGGIVLVATTIPNADGSFTASTGNVVVRNRLRNNKPADLVQDAASQPNAFLDNRCDTSTPEGLCE